MNKMNWNDFEQHVREVLEIEDDIVLSKDDVLEETEFWSSMHALLIMAMAESEYGISITGEDLRNSATLGALFELFKARVA